MTETTRTFLPAAGRDIFLPLYDPLTRLLGVGRDHEALIRQAELKPGHRVLDLGCGTGRASPMRCRTTMRRSIASSLR